MEKQLDNGVSSRALVPLLLIRITCAPHPGPMEVFAHLNFSLGIVDVPCILANALEMGDPRTKWILLQKYLDVMGSA